MHSLGKRCIRTPVDMVRVKLVLHVIKTLGRIVHEAARVLNEC